MLLEHGVVAHGRRLERRQQPGVRDGVARLLGEAVAILGRGGEELEHRDAGQWPDTVAVDDGGDRAVQVDPCDAHVPSSG